MKIKKLYLLCAGLLLGLSAYAEAAKSERPNMLVIMADDLGYGDLSCYGADDIRTPHLDKLMSEGMRFNEFYANCCVCTPTRAALLSGCYPEMVGLPGVVRTKPSNSFGFMTLDSIMLPELFRKAGYYTALIGKWHLGLTEINHPNRRGFDEFRGFLCDMVDDNYTHLRHGINYMRHNEEEIEPEGHLTDLFTEWSIEYLEKAVEGGQPFFQFLAYNAPHRPIQPPEEWLEMVEDRERRIDHKRALNVAYIEHMDDGIGKVLATLEDLGLAENTIVVFTSDNGGKLQNGASNGPLRSGKTHLYEGGIRVATCIRWPAKIKAGQMTDFNALMMDILPTLADLCGIPITHEIDGRSFKQLLLEGRQAPFEEPVFHMWRQNGTKEAVRIGNWKLVRDAFNNDRAELFNMEEDPYEEEDLSREYPERFDKMVEVLEKHIEKAEKVEWERP